MQCYVNVAQAFSFVPSENCLKWRMIEVDWEYILAEVCRNVFFALDDYGKKLCECLVVVLFAGQCHSLRWRTSGYFWYDFEGGGGWNSFEFLLLFSFSFTRQKTMCAPTGILPWTVRLEWMLIFCKVLWFLCFGYIGSLCVANPCILQFLLKLSHGLLYNCSYHTFAVQDWPAKLFREH